MTADWPTEAREAAHSSAAVAMRNGLIQPSSIADAVLAALAPHVQPCTDGWEWGVRWPESISAVSWHEGWAEDAAQRVATRDGGQLVRRRPAGEWEVAS